MTSTKKTNPLKISNQTITVINKGGVQKILSYIQNKFDIDFTNYKRPMIERRITRRMNLAGVKTLEGYSKYLEDTKGEDVALHQDLLINVTSFFRDTELFDSLSKKVLPALLKDRDSKEGLRIWIPGCSTGQEVYSIAIIVSEILEKMYVKPQFSIKIFGTDASEQAIEKARTGIYPKSALNRMSSERLAQFFKTVDGSYQVRKSLREMCVFSPHNFLKDPPFSRMDLISCQNVLIYLDQTLQKKVIRTFHYALKPTGYLALGKSETVGVEGNMFIAAEKKQKIFTKKLGMAPGQIILPSRAQTAINDKKRGGVNDTEESIEDEADKMLLAHFTPASMVINGDMEIIRFKGATSMYLEPTGSASLNLLKMVREELVLELRSLLHIAKKENHRTKKEGISMKRSGKLHLTTIEVVPLKHEARGIYFMILFSETVSIEALPDGSSQTARKNDAKDKRIAGLVAELVLQKVQMKSMGEEYEASNEELQSANEEVLSSNEELQSINEELETSQEELQSTNEELTTINDELGIRNKEIVVARDYAEAIIATVREPLLILNHDLRIKTANDIFYTQFESTPTETEGRLLYELGNGQWDIPELRRLLNEILPKAKVVKDFEIEHDFPHIGTKTMLLNACTVVGQDGKESFILLAIGDVTERRVLELEMLRAKTEAQAAKDNLHNLFMHAPAIIAVISGPDLIFEMANPMYRQLLGTNRQLDGIPLHVAIPDIEPSLHKIIMDVAIKGERFVGTELPIILDWDQSGTAFTKYLNLVYEPILDEYKKPNGLMVFGYDVTEQVLNRKKLEEVARSKDEFLSMASHELRSPVTSIKGYTQILQSRFVKANDNASAELVSKLGLQVDSLTTLIADLFDDTNVKAGKLELRNDYFDFNQLVSETIDEAQYTTQDHEITGLFGKMPNIYGDRARIKQVILNLLTNAIKYSPGTKHVKVVTKISGGNTMLSVQDFGVGISVEDQSKIFERFYRVRGKELDTYPGLGLGLYIAGKMIERHGGRMEVKSQKGEGSTFSIYLPIKGTSEEIKNRKKI